MGERDEFVYTSEPSTGKGFCLKPEHGRLEAEVARVRDERDGLLAALDAAYDEAVEVHETPNTLLGFAATLAHRLGTSAHLYSVEGFKDVLERAERAEQRVREIEEEHSVFLGDEKHPDWQAYVAANLLEALRHVPATGDWHAALCSWAERHKGEMTALSSRASEESE